MINLQYNFHQQVNLNQDDNVYLISKLHQNQLLKIDYGQLLIYKICIQQKIYQLYNYILNHPLYLKLQELHNLVYHILEINIFYKLI
ncbi:unnamed protein product [Paramecium sonneborni]|uniref:Uncharacterized protein n=1 Tax=Paramecium sonneborni TaxID=65129 RepID=A0A8S1JX01_9CILI|nr:unnamed protein product [Paramecium sonneborni]